MIAAWLAYGTNLIGNTLVSVKNPEKSAYQVITSEGEEKTEAKAEPVAVDALTLLASADPAKGAKVFKKCAACHTSNEGGKNKVGPGLWDILGRAKGSGAGFKYSAAISDLGGDWSYGDLDAFLANPKGYAKGTKMSFAGVKKASDRAALILFLRSLSGAPKPLP